MSRMIAAAFAVGLASAGSPAAAEVSVTADPECRVVRILPSGRRLVTPPRQTYAGRGAAGAAVSVAGASARGSASSTSVSSRSSGAGQVAASASTSSGRRGRTVTTTHDQNGCTVVVDDRAGRGARR